MSPLAAVRPLIEIEPDLGVELTASERDVANALCVSVHTAREGPWIPPVDAAGRACGVLVGDGLVLRQLEFAGTLSAEVLAPGDVVVDGAGGGSLIDPALTWHVLRRAQLALIDRAMLRRLADVPAVSRALMDRVAERAGRLALHQTIAHMPRVDMRLVALLWHLAGRAGRVGPDGVFLSFPLTHDMLGRLVGAKRPTVSLAMKELAERGLVRRRPDGWQLHGHSPDVPESPARRDQKADRRDAVEELAGTLRRRVEEARRAEEATARQLVAHRASMHDLRRRLAELREQSEELRRKAGELRDHGA